MKLLLICVGGVQYKPFAEAISRYAQRLSRYVPFEIQELPDVKSGGRGGATRPEAQKAKEGEGLLSLLKPGDYVMLLDERGRQYTSRQFSGLISDKMVTLPGRLVFVIGGPYGFSEAVYARADAMLSLSQMTFPHEMARLFFVEQLYRAFTIMRGEPYHHE